MKKLKRLSLVLAGAMCLTMLGGCGKNSNPAETMKEKYSKYVTLGNYAGVEYTPSHTEVTDQDVQKDIDSLVSSATTKEQVTSGVATMGDAVNIDYVGSIDGVEFEGGNTEGQGTEITLGSSGYIDDFDEQIAGHSVGETFDVNVTFPENYGKEELNGKDAVFKTTLNYISVSKAPEYNDELVAANTDYKTTEEFEQYVREKYAAQYAENDESTDKQAVLDIIVENSTISQYPEQEMKALVDDTVSRIQAAAESNSIDFSTYIMYVYGFQTEDDFYKYVEDTITNYIKEKMVIAAIAEKEGIEVSKEDRNSQVQRILDSNGYTDEADLQDYFTEEDYYYYALAEKVMTFVMEKAVPVEDNASATDATADDATADDAE